MITWRCTNEFAFWQRLMAARARARAEALAHRDHHGLDDAEIDGLELTKRLRADPKTKHIPIVMLTARGDVQDRVTGLETGVNAYLAKPFSTKELVTTVRSLLNTQQLTADMLLSQKMDSLETIAAGLAHEILNPLNYLKNALETVKGDNARLLEMVRPTEARPPPPLPMPGSPSARRACSTSPRRACGASFDGRSDDR
jgi:DNA-binding response OmpR family regulator